MANVIYRVEAPDGSILRIEGPEGASSADIESAARAQYETQAKASQAPTAQVRSPAVNAGALVDTLKDMPRYGLDAVRSFATGVGDLVVGSGQVATRVLPDGVLRPMARWADLALGGTGEITGPLAARYDATMNDLETIYQAGRVNRGLPDVGRFAGTVVSSAILGGGPAAATLPARMGQGAQIGAALGVASPVAVAEAPVGGTQEQSFWLSKAAQIGASAAFGALAPAVVEGAVRAAGALVNSGTNMMRGVGYRISGSDSKTVGETLRAEMSKQGVDFENLPGDMKGQLVAEVQKALRAGGMLDTEAVRRLADFQKLGIAPTQGQAVRDPLLFAREQNYARTGIGEPLAARFGQQNAQLIGTLDDVRGNLGASGADPYAAGQNVIAGLRARDATRKAGVDAAYGEARALAGIEAEVPAQPVAQRIGQLIEDFGEDRIPGVVMSRIKSFGMLGGEQTRVFNIREAEKLKTLIGNNIENPATPSGKALTLLSRSVDDAINSIADDSGAQAAGAFSRARGLAAERFGALDRSPAMAQAISRDPGAPEKFIEQTIIRGNIDEVANTLRQMRPDDRAEVRAAVLDWLRARSVSGVEDAAKFTQGGYNKALQTIGQRKLDLIFAGDREALAQLQALGRVGAYVQVPPVASGVNYSASGTALIDFFDRASRFPLSGLLGRPADMLRAAQVGDSLRAVPTAPPVGRLSAGSIDRVAVPAGLLSAPFAAALPSEFMDDSGGRRPR